MFAIATYFRKAVSKKDDCLRKWDATGKKKDG